eukprot:scaffold4268_cov56-Phaeocystis_antarctica.AAC.4
MLFPYSSQYGEGRRGLALLQRSCQRSKSDVVARFRLHGVLVNPDQARRPDDALSLDTPRVELLDVGAPGAHVGVDLLAVLLPVAPVRALVRLRRNGVLTSVTLGD